MPQPQKANPTPAPPSGSPRGAVPAPTITPPAWPRRESARKPEPALPSAEELLSSVVEETESKQVALVHDTLDLALEEVRKLLPLKLRDQARRYIERSKYYIKGDEKLRKCTPSSLIKAVLRAAESGLCLDGRLAYAVPYKNTYLSKQWGEDIFEAQFQASYMGMVAVARRNGRIRDAYARIVWKGEVFRCGNKDGKDYLYHQEDARYHSGDVQGAYCVIRFPDDSWRYDFMSLAELDAIRERSKARDSGPWVTDEAEMQKKSVIRRGLKTYIDDEDLERLQRIEERAEVEEVESGELGPELEAQPPPRRRIPVRTERPSNGGALPEEVPEEVPTAAAAEPENPDDALSHACADLELGMESTSEEAACREFFNRIEAAAKEGKLHHGERKHLVKRWSQIMNGFRKTALAAEGGK